MFKRNSKLMAGAALCAVLLAGCGGDGGRSADAPPAEQTISNVFGFISNLIASNDANSDPIDINGLTLATDDTSEPTPLN
ncbi:MAG: hypothetical protein ABJA84_04255 [Polaromonas sp.]